MTFEGVQSAAIDLVSDGSEFQVCVSAVENARRADSVLVLTAADVR